MRNFMEAYSAVHNTEAREELSSGRDHISEMDLSHLTSGDLVEIAEQVLEIVFETLTVKEAHEVVTSVFDVETGIEGRANKVDRLNEAFNSAFAEVGTKAASVALEHFAQYRHNKRLQETWSARFNQEKRVARVHGRLVAEEVASVRARLLTMIDEKAQKCWDTHKKVGMKKKGGKLVNNCVPKNEEVENVEEIYKGKHGQTEKQYQDSRSDAGKMVSGDSKMSGSKYAQGRRTSSDAGPQPAGGSKKPASQGKMDSGSRIDLQFRKAALKREEVELEEKKMSKAKHKEEAKKGKRWQDSDGDGKWYEKGDDVAEAIDAKGAARMDAAKGKKKETQDQIDKRLMLGKHSPAVKYAKMKKESVSFSQKELDAFEAVVNSWED